MPCAGFALLSCWGAQALGRAGFSNCSSRAWLPHSLWDLPGPGIKPVSPALQGILLKGLRNFNHWITREAPCPGFCALNFLPRSLQACSSKSNSSSICALVSPLVKRGQEGGSLRLPSAWRLCESVNEVEEEDGKNPHLGTQERVFEARHLLCLMCFVQIAKPVPRLVSPSLK